MSHTYDLIKPQLIDSAKRTEKYSWMLAPHMLRYRLNVNRFINMVVFFANTMTPCVEAACALVLTLFI